MYKSKSSIFKSKIALMLAMVLAFINIPAAHVLAADSWAGITFEIDASVSGGNTAAYTVGDTAQALSASVAVTGITAQTTAPAIIGLQWYVKEGDTAATAVGAVQTLAASGSAIIGAAQTALPGPAPSTAAAGTRTYYAEISGGTQVLAKSDSVTVTVSEAVIPPADSEVETALKDILADAASGTAEDIITKLETIGAAKIAAELEASGSADIVSLIGQLEDIYAQRAGVTLAAPIVGSDAPGNFAANAGNIKAVGAKLNAAAGKTVNLRFSKPANNIAVDSTKYKTGSAVQVNITLEGVQDANNLKVPVVLTVPVPVGVTADKLFVLHKPGQTVVDPPVEEEPGEEEPGEEEPGEEEPGEEEPGEEEPGEEEPGEEEPGEEEPGEEEPGEEEPGEQYPGEDRSNLINLANEVELLPSSDGRVHTIRDGGTFDPALIQECIVITVYYKGSTPNLLVRSESLQKSIALMPNYTNDSGNIAQFGCQRIETSFDIADTAADFASKLDWMAVGAMGEAPEVTKITIGTDRTNLVNIANEVDLNLSGISDASNENLPVSEPTVKNGGTFNPALLKTGSVVTVYFKSSGTPYVYLENWSGNASEWAHVDPVGVNVSNNIAQYNYADMVAAFGTDDFTAHLDQFNVWLPYTVRNEVAKVTIGTAAAATLSSSRSSLPVFASVQTFAALDETAAEPKVLTHTANANGTVSFAVKGFGAFAFVNGVDDDVVTPPVNPPVTPPVYGPVTPPNNNPNVTYGVDYYQVAVNQGVTSALNTVTVEKEDGEATVATVDVTVKPNTKGQVSFAVSKAVVASAISKAKLFNAKLSRADRADGTVVEVYATAEKDITGMTVRLDKTALQSLSSAGFGLVVYSGTASLELDADAVKELLKSNTNIRFAVTPVAKQTTGFPAYNVMFKDIKNKNVAELESGVITFGIYNDAYLDGMGVVTVARNTETAVADSYVADGWLKWTGDANGMFSAGK